MLGMGFVVGTTRGWESSALRTTIDASPSLASRTLRLLHVPYKRYKEELFVLVTNQGAPILFRFCVRH